MDVELEISNEKSDVAHKPPRGFVLMMSVGCALTVANIYYNQPLLADMARTLHASPRAIGLIPTLTQIGYALGMLLIVPLGDRMQRRKLIAVLMVFVSASLIAAASAPSVRWLAGASLAIGVFNCVPQILLPLTAQLSEPKNRGTAVGTVFMGLLLGILLSRTISGIVGEHFGWRAMYWIAAVVAVMLAVALLRVIPIHPISSKDSYARLIISTFELVGRERVLREAMFSGAIVFSTFCAFWATLVFRLETPPLHYGAQAAGMFGLIGASGALASPLVGRLSDRMRPRHIITIMLLLLLISFVIFWIGGTSLIGLATGVVLFDLAVQAIQVANLSRIYALASDAHSRLNSAFMVAYFAGGAFGSLAGTWAWSVAGWNGVCGFGFIAASLGLLMHWIARD